MLRFKILHQEGKARVGKLETAHGVIDTPNFIPVGTQGTVKALSPRDLKEIGVQVVLANTYHLSLRPGADLIEKFGGLHKFMGWDKPLMSDSGGFQVFSLGGAMEEGSSKVVRGQKDVQKVSRPRLNKITEEGVYFKSHLDGSTHLLTPETSIKIQKQLGADLIVAFDDHEFKSDRKHLLESLERTEKWGKRSLETLKKLKSGQLMYGVIHGGTDKDLRIRSARFTDQNFDAISIGGIYGAKSSLYQIVDWVIPEISKEKPRHLLGIGEIEDIFESVYRGIDLFDCSAPTRRARNGSLYVSPHHTKDKDFTINISLSRFTNDQKSIDPTCFCLTCQNFSKAYLRHLYMTGELLYHQLATYHNIYFLTNLMKQIREAIANSTFKKLKKEWIKRFE